MQKLSGIADDTLVLGCVYSGGAGQYTCSHEHFYIAGGYIHCRDDAIAYNRDYGCATRYPIRIDARNVDKCADDRDASAPFSHADRDADSYPDTHPVPATDHYHDCGGCAPS